MFDRFKYLARKTGQTLLPVLVALLPAIAGCDKKVAWKGVGTDSRDGSEATSTNTAGGEPSHGEPR